MRNGESWVKFPTVDPQFRISAHRARFQRSISISLYIMVDPLRLSRLPNRHGILY